MFATSSTRVSVEAVNKEMDVTRWRSILSQSPVPVGSARKTFCCRAGIDPLEKSTPFVQLHHPLNIIYRLLVVSTCLYHKQHPASVTIIIFIIF